MKLVLATLADYAQESPEGKLHLIGCGFSRIYARFPVGFVSWSLVIRLLWEDEDFGREFSFELEMIDPDDKPYEPSMKAPVTAPEKPETPAKTAMTLVFQLYNVVLEKPGVYKLLVRCEGNLLWETSIRAIVDEQLKQGPYRTA